MQRLSPMLGDRLSWGGSNLAAGPEDLTKSPSLYPCPFWFVSNINWRQYALRCHQLNNMPYPKWFLYPPASIVQPHPNWQGLLGCLLRPFPIGHRARSVLRLQDLREEVRRGWAAPNPVPTGKGAWGGQSYLLCLARRPRVL